MKKITKVLTLLVLLIIFGFAGKAQTLDFQLSVDTVFENQTLQIYNRSTGFSTSNQYKFEFSPCNFYENGSGHSCSLTKDLNDTITGFFIGNGIDSVIITLKLLDSLGNYIPNYFYKDTILILSQYPHPWNTRDSCMLNVNICTNLVCNYDFEWINVDTMTGLCQIEHAMPWNNTLNGSSSDYFNSNTTNTGYWVPYNVIGYQKSMNYQNGDHAYAGIIGWTSVLPPLQSWREYISIQLSQNLIVNQRYDVSLFINLANFSEYAVNGVQVWFTDTLNNLPGSQIILNNWSNAIDLFGNTIINDTANWVNGSGIFIPTTNNLDWLTIGNFHPDSIIPNNLVYANAPSNSYTHNRAYYIIDNVSVQPLPPEITVTGDTTLCTPNSTSVTLKAVGTGAASYLWSNSSTTDSIIVTPTVTTKYYVTATDYHGCNAVVDSATIYILPTQPKPNVWVNNDTSCFQEDSAHLFVQGTGAIGYLWNTITADTTASISVAPPTTTTYTVTVLGDNTPCNDTVLYAIVFTPIANSGQSISGNIFTCDTISTYTIINYDTNLIYVLTLDDINFDTLTSNQFTIDWLNHINAGKGDTIKLIIYEPYCDGIGYLYLKILPCCLPPSVTMVWVDSILNSSHPNYSISNNRLEFIGEVISINDTLTIDFYTYFQDCELFLGPDATIIINQADSLKFNYSTLMACDTFMWNGIFLDDTTKHLSIYNGSYVSDAINAVVSSNGGGIFLKNSTFENNYINVVVADYCPYVSTVIQSPPLPPVPLPPDFNGYIAGCDFIGNRSLPYYPHKNGLTLHGILIDSTYNFTIGDANANTNTFRDMKFGIYNEFSSLYVYNNSFYDIYLNTNSNNYDSIYDFLAGAAIFSFRRVDTVGNTPIPNMSPAISPYLVVGGSNSGEENSFDGCNTGVHSWRNQVKINNNNLNCRFNGIVCYDMWGDGNEIRDNELEINESCSNYSGIGIVAANLYKQALDLTITGNTIEDPPKTGIWVQNCSTSPQSGTSTITMVSNNIVHFDDNNTLIRYGLRFDNCDRLIAAFNQVTKDGATPEYNKMNGISVGDCKNGRIYSNYPLYHLGTGIRVVGNNMETQFYCNNFNNCKHGFYFVHNGNGIYGVGTFISHQGDSAWASDNLWSYWDANNMRIGGNINLDQSNPLQRKWFFRGIGTYDTQPFNPQIPSSYANLTIHEIPGINTNYFFCPEPETNGSMLLSDYSIREERFGEIVREEIEWATLAEEFDYSCTDYVWGEFNEDENWINLGTTDDMVYENFYNYIYESNIDEFSEIRDLIESGDLDGALMENSNIIPENTYELNQQFVNDVFLEEIANHQEIPDDKLQTLWQIASLTPWIGGEAVYTARIILGFDPDEHGLPYRYARPDTLDEKVYSAKLYPNPANNKLEIEFNTYAGEFNISFYNILGEEIYKKNIIANSNKFVLNLDKIKTGIYLVKITKDKDVICQEKIVVIK